MSDEYKVKKSLIIYGIVIVITIVIVIAIAIAIMRGPSGAKGPSGDQGDKGLKGDQGNQGVSGVQGPLGGAGPQGIQGIQGPLGIQGNQGVSGVQGITGPQGIQGIQGIQGPNGDKGPTGDQGIQGPQGIQGSDIQYLMTISPPTLAQTTQETVISGSTTIPNMSMTWTDKIGYSRNIYIAGKVSAVSESTLIIFLRSVKDNKIMCQAYTGFLNNITDGVIIINISYIIKIPIKTRQEVGASCDTGDCVSTSSIIVNGETQMYNGIFNCCIDMSTEKSISAILYQNTTSLTITEFIVTNNYVG